MAQISRGPSKLDELNREVSIAAAENRKDNHVDSASDTTVVKPNIFRLDDNNPEIFSLKTAPFLNETVPEGRQRLRQVPMKPNHIFISISSYRDANCITTLTHIFSKCVFCNRIAIGLVDQLAPEDEPCDLPLELAAFRRQIRVIRMNSTEARGPTLARYLTSRLWGGEQFVLQVDAHLKFIQDWDRRLLDMVPRMPSDKFVLSHYPVATDEELEKPGNAVPFICTAKFDEYMKGLFSQDSAWYTIEQHDGRPQASPFIGAGFMFGPATILSDVPYDRYLDFLFHGEEFAYSARLWTAGYDLVVPLENICSHVYGHRKFNAFVEIPESSLLAEYARDRVRYILGMSTNKPARMEEIDELGLGRARSFDQYLEFTGLDLVNRTINSHCADLYDWDTRQWYGMNEPKPQPHAQRSLPPQQKEPNYHRLLSSIDAAVFPEMIEPAQTYADRIRVAQQHDHLANGTFFISITSYRDGWCSSTLDEIFSKCKHCDRVFVGLVDQTLPGSADKQCIGPESFHRQMSVVRMDSRLSQGPTMARFIASKLYRNEEYYLQIDSHLKFMDGWDVELERMLAAMPTQRAVISTYPVVHTTPLDDPNMWVPWICDGAFSNGLLAQAANSWYNKLNPALVASNAVPGTSVFLGAGFMFARAQLLADVPFDRHLPFLFHGEELLMAARLWTRGWDFFIPLRNVVSHLYYERNHTVYRDRADAIAIKQASEQRARYLLGLDSTKPSADAELDELGLGSARSIDDYWAFAGLDWTTGTISNRCQQVYDYIRKAWLPRPAD